MEAENNAHETQGETGTSPAMTENENRQSQPVAESHGENRPQSKTRLGKSPTDPMIRDQGTTPYPRAESAQIRRPSTAMPRLKRRAATALGTPDDGRQRTSHEQMMSVSRLARPTVASRARTAPASTVWPERKRQQDFPNYRLPHGAKISLYRVDTTTRFRGMRRPSHEEMMSIVKRLSTYDPNKVPESNRTFTPGVRNTCGILSSWQWNGNGGRFLKSFN